ncbi:HU family DNA-binding protein [Rhizobium laguerreae]|nr:HU family DNA-binding protein [Rhizobium laguerreae]
MDKRELIAAVAEKAGLSAADAAAAVDAVFETIQSELVRGSDVRLAGFGSFSISRREGSKGRHPGTGAEIDIPVRNVPRFTSGAGLKSAVNGGRGGGDDGDGGPRSRRAGSTTISIERLSSSAVIDASC